MIDLSILLMKLTWSSFKNIFCDFQKNWPFHDPLPIKVFLDIQIFWNYHLQSILNQNLDHKPINFINETYFTFPQEYFQWFSEKLTISFSPHSLSKFCWIYKSLDGYWNYYVLAQNLDQRAINFIDETYFTITQKKCFQWFSE